MASQFPIDRTHSLLMWTIPAVLIWLLFLPSKPLRYSPFWFLRILFFGIAGYFNVLYLSRLKEVYAKLSEEELSQYKDFPKWILFWLVFCLVYAVIRRIMEIILSKETWVQKFLLEMGVLWSPFVKTEKQVKRRGALLRSIVFTILFLIVLAVAATGFYLMYNFPNMDIEAVEFTVRFANKNNYSSEVMMTALLIAGGVLVAGVIFFIMAYRREQASVLKKQDFKKTAMIECETNQISALHKLLPLLVIGITGTGILVKTLNFGQFLRYRLHPSTMYEEHYVQPTPDIIHFPEDKKNLIYIFMESYENTYTSIENGGNQTTDYMPELIKLADDNLYFSNREGHGGQSVFFPTVAYTMASSVAQTSGIPLTTAVGNPRQSLLGNPVYTNILSSAVRLEDVLHDAGYNQLFATGSDSTFGGYNTYVAQYENDELFDANIAKKGDFLSREPEGPWGVEDCLLFPVVKDKVRELAKKDAPFAVTAYTIDTHSYEHGFRCENCDSSIKDDFIASVECSNRIVSEFVHWLENEPYGDDTVVIVVGDHLADIKAKELRWADDGYVRTTYNCFIHAQKTPVNRNNRIFTTMDMFPTTLSALGVTIDGDRLGLGTDLFSATPTLCEEMGTEEFLEQVQMRSYYYNAHFWQPIELPRNVYNSHT